MPKATGPVYNVPFRRRRDVLTNYSRRLALVKSGRPRMVVRASNRRVAVQFVSFAEKGDVVLAQADSAELKGFGWSGRRNLPTAYLTGALAAKRAKGKKVAEFVLDIGLSTASKSALPFAAVKGALDAGLKTGFDEKKIDMKRVRGEHIAAFAAGGKAGAMFSAYAKEGVSPGKLPELFDAAKEKVLKGGA